ncbi:MAG: hypothetical protein WBQ72_00065 [Terriglobales bacterium]|jgi:hypothetical protein
MQFHLEADELKLVANLLLEQDSPQYSEILTMVMAHDLRFDSGQLELIAQILAAKKTALKEEIAKAANEAQKTKLDMQLALLNRALEKVNEACVMF